MTETVSLERGGGDGEPGAAPQLLIALVCDDLRAAPSRHLLADLDAVLIGRDRERRATRSGTTVRRLELMLPDRAMSSRHAQLTRVHGQWLLEDLGAKNVCLINGRAVPRARLQDGDVIELGSTIAVFRDAAVPVDGAPDLDADDLSAPLPELRTFSGTLAAQLARLATAAPSNVPVLIHGETGTGKEVAARALHELSRRRGAFVAVNCGALPAALVEAELFGHRRGAFSGAVEARPGHVRTADRGTLFLDEIGDLPAAAQATLLRVLQEGEVVPVGESLPIKVDVRVLAASHVDLPAQVAEGKFRRDLLARLGGLDLVMPTLAERREDLGLLIAALLARASGATRATLRPAAARALFQHDWPDNVRELDMALRTALALAPGGTIEVAHLPAAVRAAAAEAADAPMSDEDGALRARLVALLEEHGGNISAVARGAGKARWQIHRWLRRFGLDPESYRR